MPRYNSLGDMMLQRLYETSKARANEYKNEIDGSIFEPYNPDLTDEEIAVKDRHRNNLIVQMKRNLTRSRKVYEVILRRDKALMVLAMSNLQPRTTG
jgi:hypothetical protein